MCVCVWEREREREGERERERERERGFFILLLFIFIYYIFFVYLSAAPMNLANWISNNGGSGNSTERGAITSFNGTREVCLYYITLHYIGPIYIYIHTHIHKQAVIAHACHGHTLQLSTGLSV